MWTSLFKIQKNYHFKVKLFDFENRSIFISETNFTGNPMICRKRYIAHIYLEYIYFL